MARLLGALFFAAALMLGWGTGPSGTYACPMKNQQTAKDSSPVQLAMEEPEDGSEEAAYDDEGGDEKGE